jgi:hypothetical protein
MSDIQKDRALQENTHRVAMNILILLDIGLFPGKHTLGLEECKGFIAAIRDDSAAKMQSLVPPPPLPLAAMPDRRETPPAA